MFNKNLKNNDGLLANHIVTSENTNYPEALKYVDHFVSSVNAQLKKGAKVKIDEVGTLFLDVERNIQFEPDAINYLLDAFGLVSFQSPAIKRDNISKRLEKEFKDRGVIPAEKRKINIKRYVALAIAVPVIFAMIWIPLKTDLLKNINYSNLNPFASKEIRKPEVKKENNKTTIVLPLKNNDTTAVKPITKTDSQPVTATMVEPVKADSTAVVKTTNESKDFKFHLIAGCFQIEDNALKFLNILQQQSISASIIGKNNKGLFVVSCGNFASRKQALNELDNLRKLQPNAWLYKN